jgi:hypothetical protein
MVNVYYLAVYQRMSRELLRGQRMKKWGFQRKEFEAARDIISETNPTVL